jgi:hypothetical protein
MPPMIRASEHASANDSLIQVNDDSVFEKGRRAEIGAASSTRASPSRHSRFHSRE